MDITPIQRTMLTLAFCADSDFANPYMGDCKSATASYDDIKSKLALLNEDTGKSWDVVWGPALYSFAFNLGRHIDNAIFVVRNGTTNEYAVAVAGTDARSLADWLFEDYMVHKTVAWPFAAPSDPAPRISHATSTGLNILLNLMPCGELPGGGKQLITFLGTVVNDQPTTVYTTGHSLGGALSPTLALALQDLRSQWDPNGMATVLPFAFAGPTPGDAAFAAYFRSRFANPMQRIWNDLDIVPHAWDVAQLKQIPTLYGAPGPFDIRTIVGAQILRVQNDNYAPLNDAPPAFSGPLIPVSSEGSASDAFLAQAVCQHVCAYLRWANIEHWFPGCPKPGT